MHDLKAILDSIPTNDCLDREGAKRDLLSALSMDSTVVIENFVNTWLLTPESDVAKMSTSDKQYRLFIKEFSEKYHEHCEL